MCLRYIIEGEDAPSQLEEKVGAEGDESPEGKLLEISSDVWDQGKTGVRKHTTGMTSSWMVLAKGTMWRKQAR